MRLRNSYQTLRLILGDQLNAKHSWYKNRDSSVLYLIAELKQETNYVKHHVQKICAFFSAMAQFAEALKKSQHHVLHLTLDDTADYSNLDQLLAAVQEKYAVEHFEWQEPDEYRLAKQLEEIAEQRFASATCFDSQHFLLKRDELPEYFKKGKHVRMESFYRKMRVRFDILMEDGQPVGEQWNYDQDNRQNLKAADLDSIPEPLVFSTDVRDVLKRLSRHNIQHFGVPHESLLWPVNRKQSIQLLNHFCKVCLPNFGRFQDAMTEQSDFGWSLYHSRLSFALNCKMLDPTQVINSALKAYEQQEGGISLAQIEGFIRQILGWREYIRGVYWANMPDYAHKNSLSASNHLPEFFWSGNTKMQCVKQAVSQSLEYAYAHHIQRLMVTGNFCLLAGIDPDSVDEWYLGIYIDAIEWVELPNTRGMSQFADGGIVATKPYASSGNYINKMSDYCKSCHYSVKSKTDSNSCPFNSLYWHFMNEHRQRLSRNPRIGMIYRNWDKQNNDAREAVLARAKWCIDHLDEL